MALARRLILQSPEQAQQGRCSEKRHAQHAEIALGKILGPVERHDMSMLKAGQRQMFLTVARRHFQDKRPVGERALSSEIDTAQAAATQFRYQSEFTESLAYFRERRAGDLMLEKAMALQQQRQLVFPLREALQEH